MLRRLLVTSLTAVAIATAACAESWVRIDDFFYYDSDQLSYDEANDLVVVYTSEDLGWLTSDEDYEEDWVAEWVAFSCVRDGYWFWSESEQSWKDEITLDRSDEWDESYVAARYALRHEVQPPTEEFLIRTAR